MTEITTHVTEAIDGRYFIRPVAQGGQTVLTFLYPRRDKMTELYTVYLRKHHVYFIGAWGFGETYHTANSWI